MRLSCHLLCFTLSVFLVRFASTANALDLGRFLKRRPKTPEKDMDPEQKADEVLKYTTACDKELAKSVVILEEQKAAAEDALVICREHRKQARNDIDFLTLKVETASQKLANADEICAEKMKSGEEEAAAKLDQANIQLQEKQTYVVKLMEQQKQEIQRMASENVAALQAASEIHVKTIENLQEQHKSELESMSQKLQEQEMNQENEIKAAKASLEKAQADHAKMVQDFEAKHKIELESTEQAAQHRIDSLESQYKACDGSFAKTQRKLELLEKDQERALQKIAALENYTAFSLAKQEAKELAQHAEKKILAYATPRYEEHLKKHVDNAREKWQEIEPILAPIIKPLNKGVNYLFKEERKLRHSIFDKTKHIFIKDVCPRSRAQLKGLKKKKIFMPPGFAESVEHACSQPDEFLSLTAKIILCLAALAFHRFMFRSILFLLLLPFRILLYPCTYFVRQKKHQKVFTKKE